WDPWRLPADPKSTAGSGLECVGVRQRSACRGTGNGLRLCTRSLPQKLTNVVDAEGDEHGIDKNVTHERYSHVACRERGRDRIAGAQQPVDDPWLASDLGGVPAAEDGDEAGWEGEEGCPEIPGCRCETTPKAQPAPQPRHSQHDQSHPHHDSETKEGDQHRW